MEENTPDIKADSQIPTGKEYDHIIYVTLLIIMLIFLCWMICVIMDVGGSTEITDQTPKILDIMQSQNSHISIESFPNEGVEVDDNTQ